MWRIILSLITLGYLWWMYTILIIRGNVKFPNFKAPVTVIIPCYNEEYHSLKRTVDSVINAKGRKQIILVNNNSNKRGGLKAINEYRENPKVLVLDEERQGKRFAHSKGLEHTKHDFVSFIDSDTIINENAFIEGIKPFKDKKVGGCTGQMLVQNKNENIITKSIHSMFWTSSNIFRRATGSLGFMQVCPGAFSMYRTALHN